MSTPCQIEFKDDKKGTERRIIYKHSDGYPERMIPELKEFLKWNKERNNDLDYAAANYIYWGKTRDQDPKLGYGICPGKELYNYVSYVYRITLGAKPIIEVYQGETGSGPIRRIWKKIADG